MEHWLSKMNAHSKTSLLSIEPYPSGRWCDASSNLGLSSFLFRTDLLYVSVSQHPIPCTQFAWLYCSGQREDTCTGLTVLKLVFMPLLSMPSNAIHPAERCRRSICCFLGTPRLIFSHWSRPPDIHVGISTSPWSFVRDMSCYEVIWHYRRDINPLYYRTPGCDRVGGRDVPVPCTRGIKGAGDIWRALLIGTRAGLRKGLVPCRGGDAGEVFVGNDVNVCMSTCRYPDHVTTLPDKDLYVDLTPRTREHISRAIQGVGGLTKNETGAIIDEFSACLRNTDEPSAGTIERPTMESKGGATNSVYSKMSLYPSATPGGVVGMFLSKGACMLWGNIVGSGRHKT